MIVFQPGTVIADGLYTLRNQLGSGATAHVWSATQQLPDGQQRDIVLKILLPEIRVDAQKREMFLEEARLAASLHHPAIVEVYSIDQTQEFDFLVMERIWGSELDDLITLAKKQKSVIPWPLAVAMIRDAAWGIHYANTLRDRNGTPLNLVHRDIKPGNLLLDIFGQLKIIDFGIAKTATSHLKTQTGIIKGTIAYMSPEHLRSEKLDVRSDIYALSVVLYELCTGYRPFAGENMTSVMFSILTQEPYNPQTMRSDLPSDLCALLLRNLHKNKEERSTNAALFVQELSSLLLQHNQQPTPHDLRDYLKQHKPELFDEYRLVHGQDPPEPSDENLSTQAIFATPTNADTEAFSVASSDPTARLPGAPLSAPTIASMPGVLLQNFDINTLSDDVRDTIAQGDGAQLPDYVRQLAAQILSGQSPALPQELDTTKPIPHHTLNTPHPSNDRNAPTSILHKHTLAPSPQTTPPSATSKSSPTAHPAKSAPLPTAEHTEHNPQRNELFARTVSDNDIPLSFRLPAQQDFGATHPTSARTTPAIPATPSKRPKTLEIDGRKAQPKKRSSIWTWVLLIFLSFGLGVGGFLALYTSPNPNPEDEPCHPNKRTTIELVSTSPHCKIIPDTLNPTRTFPVYKQTFPCGRHHVTYQCTQPGKKPINHVGTYLISKQSPNVETCHIKYLDGQWKIVCPFSKAREERTPPK